MRGNLTMVPEDWPPHYNACTDPCDVIEGPCVCGAWHNLSEPWIQVALSKEEGLHESR